MNLNIFAEVIPNPHFDGVHDVTPEQVKNAQKDIFIVDVRENDEWVGELGHIENAKLINLSNLPNKISDIQNNKTVVIVCKSG